MIGTVCTKTLKEELLRYALSNAMKLCPQIKSGFWEVKSSFRFCTLTCSHANSSSKTPIFWILRVCVLTSKSKKAILAKVCFMALLDFVKLPCCVLSPICVVCTQTPYPLFALSILSALSTLLCPLLASIIS